MDGICQLFCGQFRVFLQRSEDLQVGFIQDFCHILEFYSV
jgi:hypothetical protein